ncbi:MAG: protein with putative role during mitosis [Tremellales sp. Tagirdzhanova-0007]|nr:MAG: protein with putative role during mitosis [Tremellales sp. Tagirdzhanova-0007]
MASLLSERQKEELHKSMLSYLHATGLHHTYEALKKETDNDDFEVDDPKARWVGLLEKKWTSVIRLQKKIMDLESRNAALLAELASPSRASSSSSSSSTPFLPRAPARHTLTSHRASITRVSFHPTWTVLASASEDATVKIWDWESGDFERTVKGHTKAVMDVEFDSKGALMVTCSSDLTIKLWDPANEYTNTKTLHGHDHSVSSVRFTPDGDTLISASRDKTIRVWEVASGYCVRTFPGHAEWVREVVPSEDGRWLTATAGDTRAKSAGAFAATGSRDKSIRIWDVHTGQCLRILTGHDNWIRALVFHPTGKYLLSASDDKTVRTWDLATGRCVKTVDAHGHFVTCMTWGRAVLGGPTGDGKVVNGDSNTGTAVRRINVLATGSVDQTIK